MRGREGLGEMYSRASKWGSRSRVRCHMSELVVVLNDFSDPWAVSTDVGIDSWLLFGSTGHVTPRYKASETVSTHQRTPRIALWKEGESHIQKHRERKTEKQKETQRHVEKGRETCRDGEKYSGTEREADRQTQSHRQGTGERRRETQKHRETERTPSSREA